jgi:hypothetical protein
MYMGDLLLPSQTHGVMVYVPKIKRPTTPDDYRPLTLLNADLKLLSRIISNRLRTRYTQANTVEWGKTTYSMQSPP